MPLLLIESTSDTRLKPPQRLGHAVDGRVGRDVAARSKVALRLAGRPATDAPRLGRQRVITPTPRVDAHKAL